MSVLIRLGRICIIVAGLLLIAAAIWEYLGTQTWLPWFEIPAEAENAAYFVIIAGCALLIPGVLLLIIRNAFGGGVEAEEKTA